MAPRSFQPLSVREIINAAGSLYRQNLGPLLLLSFLTFAPIAAIGVALQLEMLPLAAGVDNGQLVVATQEQLDRLNLVSAMTAVITLIGMMVSMASLHNALSEAFMGEPVDWRASLRAGVSKIGWVIVITLAIAALMIVPFVVLGVVASSPALFALLAIAVGVFVVWAVVATSLAMPVLMREGVTAATALNRSKELVSGFWLRTMGIYIVGGLLSGMITLIVGKGLGAALTASAQTPDALIGGASVGLILANVLSTPLFVAFVTVVYFDLRIRKEQYGPDDFDRESGIVRPSLAPHTPQPLQAAAPLPPRPVPPAPRAPGPALPAPPPPTTSGSVRGPRWSEPLPNER